MKADALGDTIDSDGIAIGNTDYRSRELLRCGDGQDRCKPAVDQEMFNARVIPIYINLFGQ